MENRVRTLLLDDAMTRYLNFKRDYPGLEAEDFPSSNRGLSGHLSHFSQSYKVENWERVFPVERIEDCPGGKGYSTFRHEILRGMQN